MSDSFPETDKNDTAIPQVIPPAILSSYGILTLVATPIGNLGDITDRARTLLEKSAIVACEDTRHTAQLLSLLGIRAQKLLSCHDHNEEARSQELINTLLAGQNVAYVSDAGMPMISDPGFKLVRACIAAGITVTCAPGANAVLTALCLSGLPPEPFLFAGFIPAKASSRADFLRSFAQVPATLVFYETAPRISESLATMTGIYGNRAAAIARELTKKFEEIRRGSLTELQESCAATPPRGEIVVMVAPPTPEMISWDTDRIDAALRVEMTRQKLAKAVATVASLSGESRDSIYARAVVIRESESHDL